MGETDAPDTEQAPADMGNQTTFGQIVRYWVCAVIIGPFVLALAVTLGKSAIYGVIGLFDSLFMQVFLGGVTVIIVAFLFVLLGFGPFAFAEHKTKEWLSE